MSNQLDVLRGIADLIQSGKQLDENVSRNLQESLSYWQAKIDCVQIGATIHSIGRLPVIATRIAEVEDSLFNRDERGFRLIDLMQGKDLASLLKTLYSEYHATRGHVEDRASSPTISSTDTMTNVSVSTAPAAAAPRLPAASRDAVRSYLNRLSHRMVTVEATVTESKPLTKPKPKAKSPKPKPKKVNQ